MDAHIDRLARQRTEMLGALEEIDWYCDAGFCTACCYDYPDKVRCIRRKCGTWDIRRYARQAIAKVKGESDA